MIKSITLIGALLMSVGTIPRNAAELKSKVTGKSAEALSVTITPSNPLIEKGLQGQYLNFDIIIKNTTRHVLTLATIESSVMDASARPIFKQSVNVGEQSGLKSIGNTTLKPGQSVDIFNPFYLLSSGAKITFLQYEFFFDYADSPKERENNKKRLPVDFDLSVKKIITPRIFTPRIIFNLPMAGKLIVLDGHNFYPGQSNGPMGTEQQVEKIVTSKANRYAYNLASVDENGNMYASDPFKKENWYVFGKAVYAPSGGIVADVQNNIPDNSYIGRNVKSPVIPPDADPYGMGNYIVIDHGNGQFSLLQHLEQGSIIVRKGELVKGGQMIGKVGFSGNASFPHLHFALMNGKTALTAIGIPAYFGNYRLYQGKNFFTRTGDASASATSFRPGNKSSNFCYFTVPAGKSFLTKGRIVVTNGQNPV
ncbi:MAG TPA: peptidoglycan DD-metalloendopeptidase family protein [Mucilaginibacter sp.]|nr:peptidoglycan DD-metalloendopeptidase family protein [Mucilaginibacter sp.]